MWRLGSVTFLFPVLTPDSKQVSHWMTTVSLGPWFVGAYVEVQRFSEVPLTWPDLTFNVYLLPLWISTGLGIRFVRAGLGQIVPKHVILALRPYLWCLIWMPQVLVWYS